jgi:hypothetical protein
MIWKEKKESFMSSLILTEQQNFRKEHLKNHPLHFNVQQNYDLICQT